ncbi:uncharacterized protein SCHCODRAFT_02632147 [Schizophyllum commune H4-8]|uniref:Protein YAE1 n=1 Tax=Schizophyllum commune (strain H4-8 / FGSC 9210) TaxID=578458 RepID=D8Q959_SCHCM|nr:uncharacterized protein SCHCODRAFT_02632147 [Schizophyllum commune H4-8]KAI5890541.1 hypothetical protein SCHCODRAFT_02632147 [Schizophyllum commune H4-8]
MDLDSPWDEVADSTTTRDAEWAKLSSDFTNAGYREGITAGKESALQEGFDSGFADVGAPLGRELGLLRGMASALLSFLSSQAANAESEGAPAVNEGAIAEVRDISRQLAHIRLTDIAPRDLEAEAHAKEHLQLEEDEDLVTDDELLEKRKMEALEDQLARLTSGTMGGGSREARPTADDVRRLKGRLDNLTGLMGLAVAPQ